jgi:hypothetical protein
LGWCDGVLSQVKNGNYLTFCAQGFMLHMYMTMISYDARVMIFSAGVSCTYQICRFIMRRGLTELLTVCRWDAAQRLAKDLLMSLYEKVMVAKQDGKDVSGALAAAGVSKRLIEAYRAILTDTEIDGSTAAITLALPSQSELVQDIHEADPTVVHAVRGFVRKTIGQQLMPELLEVASPPPPPLHCQTTSCPASQIPSTLWILHVVGVGFM